MGAAAIAWSSAAIASSKFCACFSGTKMRPGLVQNCPAPKVSEATNAFAKASFSFSNFCEKQKIGLTDPISANTGMGTSRWLARWNKAMPPACEPVNASAFARGCLTNAWPSAIPPSTCVKRAEGSPHADRACWIHSATFLEVSGWAGCAL